MGARVVGVAGAARTFGRNMNKYLPFLLIFLFSCDPPPITCAPLIEVLGASKKSVAYEMNAACSNIHEKFPDARLIEKIGDTRIQVRLYSPSFFGDGPQVSENCTHYRSGTCTKFMADGSIMVEIRKDENTAYKVVHEMQHVALYLANPDLPVTMHHEWMAENKLCTSMYESCGRSYGVETNFSEF